MTSLPNTLTTLLIYELMIVDCSHAVKGWLTSVVLVTIGKLINLAPRTDLKVPQ